MHRGEIFWRSVLVVLGALCFLKAAGYLTGDVFGWFWPLMIMAAGAWILLGGFEGRDRHTASEKFSVPLAVARSASLTIEHGAGHVEMRSGADSGDFLTGVAGIGISHSAHLNGDTPEVRIEAGPSFIPFIGSEGGVWECRLNPDVPTAIVVQSGASRMDFDLTDLRVTRFSFEGGASRLDLALPAKVENALFDIEAGAATIELRVPPGLALRFRTNIVGALRVDEARFPLLGPGLYQTADIETAKCRADVTVDGGATSVRLL